MPKNFTEYGVQGKDGSYEKWRVAENRSIRPQTDLIGEWRKGKLENRIFNQWNKRFFLKQKKKLKGIHLEKEYKSRAKYNELWFHSQN